jgi:hypothetical protein
VELGLVQLESSILSSSGAVAQVVVEAVAAEEEVPPLKAVEVAEPVVLVDLCLLSDINSL